MGLLRDTMVVGAATFIVGSVLREVSLKERSGEPVGWWPYVGTFVAGALGYYLVRATNVVKASENTFHAEKVVSWICDECGNDYHTEDDAEECRCKTADWTYNQELLDGNPAPAGRTGWSDVECSHCGDFMSLETEIIPEKCPSCNYWMNAESFSAETFEAKARRRTRFAWAIGKDPISPPNDDYENHTHRDYMKYHIKGLPPGYFIHLSKYDGYGKHYWETNFKSPHETGWKHEYHHRKSDATKEAIEWYNIQVAKPETQKLTPMQKMMISKGVSKRKFALHMTDTTKPIHGKNEKGQTIVVGETHTIRFYVMGGASNMKPFEYATIHKGNLEIKFPHNAEAFDFVLPFIQGMIYIGGGNFGIRSVNHYNKNRQAWINKHPAWFKNMVKHKLSIHIDKYEVHTAFKTFYLNGTKFVRFGQDTTGSEATYKDGKTAIYGTGRQEYYAEGEWKELRPTTQKKLLAKAIAMAGKQEDIHGNMLIGRLFLLYVDKLNPFQPDTGYVKSYTTSGVRTGDPNTEGFMGGKYGRFVREGAELMARRYRPKV